MNDIDHTILALLDKINYGILYIKNSNNNYLLFNRYNLKKKKTGVVDVKILHSDYEYQFSNFKTATAWCILDYKNKILPAKRLFELDNKLAGLEVKIKIHGSFNKIKDTEKTEIYRDKLLSNQKRIASIKYEIDKYIIMADYCQNRGFENEFK